MQVMTGMDVRSRRAERRCYGRASKSGRLSSPAGSRATTTAGGNGSAASGATRSASRASALARTPSRRSRRVRSTRFRHCPAARRISRASSVCAASVRSRVDDPEVVEAQLDADRLRRVALAREVAGELLAQLGEDRAELGAVAHGVQVAVEGRLAADRLGLARGDDGALVAPVRGLVQPGAVALAEVLAQATPGRRAASSPIVCDAERGEPRARPSGRCR